MTEATTVLKPQWLEEDKHWWFASRTRALLGMLDRCLPDRALRILDVGCGAGNMIHHLSRYGQVTGIDNNPKPLIVAQERGYDVRLGDATEMPFADGAFGLVAALDLIEHCPDDMAILSECHRVCASGGLLVATVPAFQWLWSSNDVINRHYRRYTAGELSSKLAQVGFRIRRMTYNNFFVFPLTAALILARRVGAPEPDLAAPHVNEDVYQVEMEPAPPLLNAILTGVGWVEANVLRWLNLPIGTSIICVAEKSDDG